MKFPVGKLIAEVGSVYASYLLLLFVLAGTLRWWAGWVFVAIYFIASTAIVIWLVKVNQGLLKERMTGLGGPHREQWDKGIVTVLILLYVLWIVVMPLDAVRFHWSHFQEWLQVVGGVLLCLSFYMLFLTYRENPFLSPAVRMQEERSHAVISTGPYRYVRHPMYAASVVQFVGSSLLLGSWLGLLFSASIIWLLAWRAVLEERMLSRELQGYTEYMERVRYRLVPYIW